MQSTSGWAACRVEVQPETNWRAVADSVQALGIWELPLGGATEPPGSEASDQDGVVGEVLVGDRYGRFEDLPGLRAAAALVGGLPGR